MKAKVIEIKGAESKEEIKKAICEAISETVAQEVEEAAAGVFGTFNLALQKWPENRKKAIEAIKDMIEHDESADAIAAFLFAVGFVEGYNTAIDEADDETEEECEENELN